MLSVDMTMLHTQVWHGCFVQLRIAWMNPLEACDAQRFQILNA